MMIIDINKIQKNQEKLKEKSKFTIKESKKYVGFELFSIKLIVFIILLSIIFACLTFLLRLNYLQKNEENIQPSFIINTKVNSYKQFLMKSSQNINSISNSINSNYSIFSQAKYDIYTLNESIYSGKSNLYSTIFFTAIIINSQCFEFENNKTNCELKQYLDLTIKNKNNYGKKNIDLEQIKEAMLPICLIEHSHDNIILSVTCPESLSENLKNNIILAFKSIKPNFSRGKIQNNSLNNITIKNYENQILIKIFNNICENNKINKNEKCETIKLIKTDNIGNLKLNNIISKYEFIKDKNNIYYDNFNYSFEETSNQEISKGNNFKYNLNRIIELIKPLMKKEEYIFSNKFNNSSKYKFNRKLEDKNIENFGMKEESFFTQSLFGVNISLNIKNDFGLGNREKSKLISNFIRGSKSIELTHEELSTNINETLNKFIVISKAGNKLANSLYQELNKILSKLPEAIISNISELNNLLHFEDLSSIFDSTSAIDYLNILPNSIISASENLYSNISLLYRNIENSIINIKNNLKNNISSFLSGSHSLLNNIINNLRELYELLSSDKSIITEISSYYLNDNNISYLDKLKETKIITENYNIEEKNSIETLLNRMLMEFSINFIDSLRLIHSLIDKIINNIENESLSIYLANNTDIEKLKNNLYNTKTIVYEIMPNIENIIRNGIGIHQNGYFESQNELDNNKRIYEEILNKLFNISNILDNNLLLDTTFDDIMKNFKNKFIKLLNSIEKSKREKFPIKNNIFINSSYIQNTYDKMEEELKEEKKNILNYINEENKYYLDSIENLKLSLINEQKIDNIINNIDSQLSELNLNNLNSKYNELLTTTFNSINSVIENNKNLAIQYLTNVYNAGSSYCTQLFLDKSAIFYNSLNQVTNFIQNLKVYLSNIYINMINKIKTDLQNIKINPILKKYSTYLPFTENHLRLVDILLTRFDKYISNELFNKNYETTINNYINTIINYLIEIQTAMNNLYNPITSLTYSSSSTYDYYKYRQSCYKKCHRTWYLKKKCSTYCDDYYDGYNVEGGDNHLNLININFTKYTETFDLFFNNYYSQITKYIQSYNNVLNSFENNINLLKSQLLNKQPNYLNNISTKINNYIKEEFCNNYIILSYNYFKNDIQDNLILEINKISYDLKEIFDEINKDINLNINKFKYSIKEFGILGELYYKMYHQNISYYYANSIIDQRKNDFNYTIKYYYNLLLLKVNKTYSYIFNKFPNNEALFNDILNKRSIEIKSSYNNLINQIYATKNKYLDKNRQLNIIGVKDNNFFNINSNIENNNKNIQSQLISKNNEILNTIKKIVKESSIESIVSRFYLENLLNERQLKEIYELTKQETFIDLENDAYRNLANEIIDIDKEELIQSIKNYLIKSNNLIEENFRKEKEKYENILQNKIYKEFYTKENLENKINNIYSNGLTNNLDNNSKNLLYSYLNEVLNRIKSHITNEVSRLSNELTSYSNNYNIIKNRLNNYKTLIYDKFYSTILSVNNDFYSQILSKFYTNNIDKYLNEFLNYANKEKYEESKFLNKTIILKNIQKEIIEKLVKEYKYLAINHINYLNQKNIQQLNQLFIFTNIQNTINNEIDNIYNNQLLPILKQKAIYNIDINGISNYDLSNITLNDINTFLDSKINQVKEIINKSKGNKYNIIQDWKNPDFSLLKREEFLNIQTSFNNFYKKYHDIEVNEINQIIYVNIRYNFKMIIENFIPSFGKDFFERIIKYNKIIKTKSLYNNLKLSSEQTINYYIKLFSQNPSIIIPEDLKIKILSLNNIDLLINSLNNDLISKLNQKFDKLFDETKGYFVDSYIYALKNNKNIKLSFDDDIKEIIYKIADNNTKYFEIEYLNLINYNIKNEFIEEYKIMLNEETNNIIIFINENKNLIKTKLNSLNAIKTELILSDINSKLNNVLESINNYNNNFNSFQISNEIRISLNNYSKSTILPYYKEIKSILDDCTKDIVLKNLNKNINKFKSSFIFDDFKKKSIDIRNELKNLYFKNMTDYIYYSYGKINSVYSNFLNNEIINLEKLRRLDNLNDDNQKIVDIKIDETFKLLKRSSAELVDFIQNLYLFYSFDEKINKYINEINEQFILSQNNIKNIYDDNITQIMNQNLTDIKNHVIQYYNKINSSFYEIKEFLNNKIDEINELIEKTTIITLEEINKKYMEIKNNFVPINYKIIKEIPIEIEKHIEKFNEVKYIIEAEIDKYLIEKEIILDLIFEGGELAIPKLKGKIINKSHPNRMVIDFYTNYGYICEIKGKKMTINFNNISLISDFVFDVSSNTILINNYIDFDEYNIRSEKYTIEEKSFIRVLGGITFVFPTLCKSTLDGETEIEVVN